MIDDKQASELVSKSLRAVLDKEEAARMDEHLKSNEETRKFARLSTAIQDSVVGMALSAEEGDPSVAPGLSAAARERMRDSVRQALRESGRVESDSSDHLDRTSRFQDGVPAGVAELASLGEQQVGDVKQLRSRFALVRKLGEGGLGTVWLARDEKLRRNVAIKQMNSSSLESVKNWQRFHREAEITGHLEHPNIVPLYQFGIDSVTNEPFYAMRFVGKRTLADAILEYHDLRRSGEIDELGLHRLLSDFLDVCQAIAYAHSRGVIHRDLKPENVALDNFGQVIVLDWGLAKLTEQGELATQLSDDVNLADEALAKTMVGEVIGTPLYMAPEQAAGDLDRIDERTDVYGLGAILFSILTGMAPHENSSRADADGNVNFREVLRSIVDGETPRPREVAGWVPRELEAICQKAMSKKPYGRFASAAELAGLVERWMAGQSQKKSRYETLRMEGRELRADMQSTVRDLETNVRFMLRLPPVQELIHSEEDQIPAWRDRLATIFKGLLSANADYQTIVYCKIEGDRFREMVRVERHSTEHSNIRSIPKSRLLSHDLSDYLREVMRQKPEEVLSSLVCDPMCDQTCDRARLVAGVPVYDERSEEEYGFILIDLDLDRVFRKQMERRSSACEVVVACDTHHILMHSRDNLMVEASVRRPINENLPFFRSAVETLQTEDEYIDDCDRAVYGARLWLIPNKHGLMYLLNAGD